MYWFWLNMPLAAVFFGAWVGIPMWLVVKRPGRGARPPGVFAAGDARHGAVRRVASAVGEGAITIPLVHHYFDGIPVPQPAGR